MNTINEIENTFDRLNRGLEEVEEWINDQEDKVMESNQTEQMREKICEVRIDLGNSVIPSSVITFTM